MDTKLKGNYKKIEWIYWIILIGIISITIGINELTTQEARINESDNGSRYFTTEEFYFNMFGDFENIYSQYIYKMTFEGRNTIDEYNKTKSLFEEAKLRYNREHLYDRPSSNVKYMILNENSGKWGGNLTSRQREKINIKNYDKVYSLTNYIETLEKDMRYLWHIRIDSQGVLDTDYTSSGIRYSNDMYRSFCEEYRIEPLKDIEIIYMIPKELAVQDELYRGVEQYRYYGYQDPILLIGIIGVMLSMLLGLIHPNKYINEKGIIHRYNKIPFEIKIGVILLSILCFKVYMYLSIGIGTENLIKEMSRTTTIDHGTVKRMLIVGNITALSIVYFGVYINSRYIRKIIQVGMREAVFNNIWLKDKKKVIKDKIKRPYEWISIKVLSRGIITINFIVIMSMSLLGIRGMILGVIYSIITFILMRKYLKDIQDTFNRLQTFTYELEKGNLDAQIESELGVFSVVGESLNKVKDGFKQAVEKEVKSERMKTELISNVSHDLKTPLTSIISYIDLLKTVNLEEDTRKGYIQILEIKSRRLQVLIEDLFEVSKAASGNIALEVQEIDIVALMNQIIGELKDKIDKSGLEFKVSFPMQKIIVLLDGRKMFRVIENLIVNCIKYAMVGSRVFVDIIEVADGVSIIIKNISAQEMKFTAEEIVERFNRGDTSRNTEGSGLGLAISKSLTELQGGNFEIILDGDLFKVIITFKKSIIK